jgi:hypothetical protein
MRWALCGLLLVALPASARQQPPAAAARTASTALGLPDEPPEERLGRARQAYLNNDFASTVAIARDLLYPVVRLRTEDDVEAAHRLLALAHFLSRDYPSAEREFSTLLALRPDFALDAVIDPPQAITFLEQLRARELSRLEQIERRRREEAERAAREDERRRREEEDRRVREAEERVRRSLKPVVIEKHSRWVCLVPLGAGQFQNGERGKGRALLSTQAVLGGTSLALWLALEARYDFGRTRVPRSEVSSAQALQIVSLVTGGLFWADVAYGVIDALVRFRPEVVRGAPPPSPPRVELVPQVLPQGGAGLWLRGSF